MSSANALGLHAARLLRHGMMHQGAICQVAQVRAAARLVFTRQTWLTLDIFDHLLIYLAAKFMLLVWLLAISLFWPSHESGAKPARGARKISM